MLKLFKEFKPFTISVILIVALLFGQAMAELALPDYMSNIVDVGIQQNGIEYAVPEVIREKELKKIELFLDEKEIEELEDSYRLISKENLDEKEYKKFYEKYEVLENEPLYILEEKSESKKEELDDFLARGILAVNAINTGEVPFPDLPEGTDPFTVISDLPQEELSGIRENIDKTFEELPGELINQSAIYYIKEEYKALGISIEDTQTKYILNIGGIMLLIALAGMVAAIFV